MGVKKAKIPPTPLNKGGKTLANPKTQGRGRKTLYKSSHPATVEGWVKALKSGKVLTKTMIARRFGVDLSTVLAWEKEFPEFSLSLTRAREHLISEDESALHNLAVGHKVTLKAETLEGIITHEEFKQDYRALALELAVNDPDNYILPTKLEHTGKGGGPIANQTTLNLDHLSDEKLDALIALGNKETG